MWIIVMSPIMYGLFRLVCWADCLHTWHYSGGRIPPPTTADFTRAAIVYWAFLLIPVFIGCVAAFMSFQQRNSARWPLSEIGILAIPYATYATGLLLSILYRRSLLESIVWFVIFYSCVLIGGAVVAAFSNLGACLFNRTWGKLSITMVVIAVGMIYLWGLSTFIIYIDT